MTATQTDCLKPTAFDRVWSSLTAALVVTGFAVLLLFGVWLTNRQGFFAPRDQADVVGFGLPEEESLPESGGQPSFSEVAASELPLDPSEIQLENSLLAVSAVVNNRADSLDGLEGNGASRTKPGDPRKKNPSDRDADLTPKWERWRLHFSTNSLAAYARQLDRLGIELGAAGGGRPQIDYASKLSSDKPRRRSGVGKAERRLYMTWKSGGVLRAFDQKLLEKAGIPTENRIVLQFLSAKLEAKLAELERELADGRDVVRIKRTVFAIGRNGELSVKKIELRKEI